MPTFIKTGYWESIKRGFKGYLNLDELIKDIVPANTLTLNEIDAIQGAATPSGTNVFSTENDLATKQNVLVTNNSQTGISYILALTDDYVTCTNANDVTVTVPLNSSVQFPIGKVITLEQGGIGQIIISPAGGVIVNSLDSGTKSSGQYAILQIVKKATDVWTLIGAAV